MAFGGVGMAALGGLAQGYTEGTEIGMKEQLQQMALAGEKQQQELTTMEINQRKSILDAQKDIAAKFAGMNQQMASDPMGLAQQMAERSMIAGDSFLRRGLTEQADSEFQKGIQMLSSAATMQDHLLAQQAKVNDFISGLAAQVLEPGITPAERQKRSDRAITEVQATYPQSQLHMKVGDPVDLTTWHTVLGKTTDATKQADIRYKELEGLRAKAAAAADYAKAAKDAAQTKALRELEDHGGKEGDNLSLQSPVMQSWVGRRLAGEKVQDIRPGSYASAQTSAERKQIDKFATLELIRQNPDWSPMQAGEELTRRTTQLTATKAGASAYQRTVETKAGGLASTIESMVGQGDKGEGGYAPDGTIGQYVEAARRMDFSSFKGFAITQEGYAKLTGDPDMDFYALKANAVAMDYAVISGRGARGAAEDREHALKLMAGAKSIAQAETIGAGLLQEAKTHKRGTEEAAKHTPGSGGSDDAHPVRYNDKGEAVRWDGKDWVPYKGAQ